MTEKCSGLTTPPSFLLKVADKAMKRRVISIAAACAGLAATMLLSSCAGSPPPSPDMPRISPELMARPPVGQGNTPIAGQLLRPDDRISISVAREPTLSLENVRVAADGFVDLPYLGRIQAAGRTTTDVAREIRDHLAATYLTDPHVAVNVIEYSSHIVTVEGAVGHSGQFTFTQGTTLLGAVAAAGGPARVAKLDRILIFRNFGNERRVAVFNMKDLRSGKGLDPLLEPGDQVVVGFSDMQQGWLDFLQAVPVLGIFLRYH